MAEAAAKLPPPSIYGIASCRVGTEYHDFEVGLAEVERDAAWAESVLREAGLAKGDVVLLTLSNWESPWTAQVIRAIRNIGAVYTTAEIYGWDARRAGMFLQRLPIKAFIGLAADTVTALGETPETQALLADVPLIWARPGAIAEARKIAPQAAEFTPLGPALGLGLPNRPGVLVNAREWDVAEQDGQLVVSSVGERAASWTRFATGLSGRVLGSQGDSATVHVDGPFERAEQ
jgi:hypothetical protein